MDHESEDQVHPQREFEGGEADFCRKADSDLPARGEEPVDDPGRVAGAGRGGV